MASRIISKKEAGEVYRCLKILTDSDFKSAFTKPIGKGLEFNHITVYIDPVSNEVIVHHCKNFETVEREIYKDIHNFASDNDLII